MKNQLEIINETNKQFLYLDIFEKIVDLIHEEEKLKMNVELSLIIISDEKMKELNFQYRKKESTTDVLSFPEDYLSLAKVINYYMLGDIYMSYEKIVEQATEYNHSDLREWTYIFTHGCYHLLGFDHQNENDEKIMNDKVSKIMGKINIGRNNE